MIRYALRCECGHAFDSWFQSSTAYDSQIRRKLVTCPLCDSAKVEKALMAPRLTRQRRGAAKDAPTLQTATPAEQPVPEPAAPLMMAPQEREFVAKLRELRNHVIKTAENVGTNFPNEARKMHYGDIKHRAIYGEATSEQTRALLDEGVEVLPLPVLPGDRN